MQNGRYKLSDRVSNKNSRTDGIASLMRSCSVYGPQLVKRDELAQVKKTARSKPLTLEGLEKKLEAQKELKVLKEERIAEQARKDAPILEEYWAKKEELELLYNTPDSQKKWDSIKAMKAELDEMYKKYVCIRKDVWAKKQERLEKKRNVRISKLPIDLYSLVGRAMTQRELDEFLASIEDIVTLDYVQTNDGMWVKGFEVDGYSYYPTKTKNGFRWEVSLL